ncbi:hypothetical protein GYMLUDRAFT_496300 [Collybiopsis luxurians FD-317 M1]|uniref:Uncharacterized protein n=1 Tax=Collybiopsis luxurians FD-317 M1 TaxID=944289 RepID=A0A0D0C2M0_9AGAR|nr:hypothetical protein GYMLUDRAFT_496300 [Collybiopsis luxurians FD-317 M1]
MDKAKETKPVEVPSASSIELKPAEEPVSTVAASNGDGVKPASDEKSESTTTAALLENDEEDGYNSDEEPRKPEMTPRGPIKYPQSGPTGPRGGQGGQSR